MGRVASRAHRSRRRLRAEGTLSFRARVTLAAGVSVAVAIAAASVAAWFVVRAQLLGQIDEQLREQAALPGRGPVASGSFREPPEGAFEGASFLQDRFIQIIDEAGEVIVAFGGRELPVTDRTGAVAAGEAEAFIDDVNVAGERVRVYTAPVSNGQAIQLGQSLGEMEATLVRLGWALAVVSAVGVGMALVLGRVTAATAIAPVHRLSSAAKAIAVTGDPAHPIEVRGTDELATLASSFNTMLAALDSSLRRQRALVPDASHELRTPITSIRTNAEILHQRPDLDERERRDVLAEIVAEAEEMTNVVAALLDSARLEETHEPTEEVRLDSLVDRAVNTARRRYPHLRIDVAASPTTVIAMPHRLERAVANLLDNAAKWSPVGAAVEVHVADHEVSVRDHGPGLAPEDLDRVFDRFWRATNNRASPGVGLGLAIVRQVAEDHGGSVTVVNAEDGGACFTMYLDSQRVLR